MDEMFYDAFFLGIAQAFIMVLFMKNRPYVLRKQTAEIQKSANWSTDKGSQSFCCHLPVFYPGRRTERGMDNTQKYKTDVFVSPSLTNRVSSEILLVQPIGNGWWQILLQEKARYVINEDLCYETGS